jgi:hypothetical protein
MTKLCSKCQIEKDISEFYPKMGRCKKCHNGWCIAWAKRNPYKNREISKKWYHAKPENRQRSIDKARRWQKANRERDKLQQFRNSLLRNYNLPYEEYSRMVEDQNGKCAICLELPSRTHLDVDHNHATGKIRQLLCSRCNTAIGLLKESQELFQKATEYLLKHNSQSLP